MLTRPGPVSPRSAEGDNREEVCRGGIGASRRAFKAFLIYLQGVFGVLWNPNIDRRAVTRAGLEVPIGAYQTKSGRGFPRRRFQDWSGGQTTASVPLTE